MREVFFPGNIDINLVAQQPRSMHTSVVDKLYRHSSFDTPEFGEITSFTQRYSGFFVPPMSSLYTFNVRSDDQSQLYLSSNASSEVLGDPIINVPQYTRNRYKKNMELLSQVITTSNFFNNSWNFFPEQFSKSFYLEAGQYYYFEMVSNQGGGPWDIGLAAKVHSLNHTSYPYQGDKERQRINITSSAVQEKIVSDQNLEVLS